MNLTQASRATGLTKKALRELIISGDITATKGKKDWDIDATSLADKVGLPSFMTWQQTNKAMQEQLDLLLKWKAEVEHVLVVLEAKVALKHISRRQLAEWLGTHGLNSHAWEQIRALDRHIHHERNVNQQDDALTYVVLHVRRHPRQYADTMLHECPDAGCICHTLLPELLAA